MIALGASDLALIGRVGQATAEPLTAIGRADAGELGGAIFVRRADGRDAVLTVFPGEIAAARRVGEVVNALHARGLPVPRHEAVVDLGDRVVVVQERLPSAPARPLSVARVDAIVAIIETFAGVATGIAGIPPLVDWFRPDDRDPEAVLAAVPRDLAGARTIGRRIAELVDGRDDLLGGDDVVHTDLTAANVLFDEHDRATGVVDWGLGVYRGDRTVALVQTRFDREWFVRRADADPAESAAADHLDRILAERLAPDALRALWAFWLLHQLPRAAERRDGAALRWQLDLAASRLA